MLCPRCHLNYPFPSGFARISSEVLPWDSLTPEPTEQAEPGGPDMAPEPRVEAMLCLTCCTDLQTMMRLLFPSQLVSITRLDDDHPPG